MKLSITLPVYNIGSYIDDFIKSLFYKKGKTINNENFTN